MQAKLHRWAGEDSARRFGDLFNLVCDPLFLAEAWLRVSGNDGKRTPGIDAATLAGIENGIGVGALLEEIRGLLKSGEFRPVSVRQVMIPKKSGKFRKFRKFRKLRKLGIPTVTDRVVQASLTLVLEPVFEADFQPFSYGFRPGRRLRCARRRGGGRRVALLDKLSRDADGNRFGDQRGQARYGGRLAAAGCGLQDADEIPQPVVPRRPAGWPRRCQWPGRC